MGVETKLSDKKYAISNREGSLAEKETKELDKEVETAARYLERLDRFAEFVAIDPATGKIEYTKPALSSISDKRVEDYQKRFTALVQFFKPKNSIFEEKIRKDPNVLDVKNIMGATLVTYDSAKGLPEFFSGGIGDNRGEYHHTSNEYGETYLGLVPIDINKKRRKQDDTSATISAIHELQHHALAMTDYLAATDSEFDMQSADRTGRNIALFGNPPNRISTNQAYIHDTPAYEKLLGREFNEHKDIPRLQEQLRYLDELHSSFLQRKPNWFNAIELVYSTKGKGKHWELVGDNREDVEASKKLFSYLQTFYILDNWRKTYETQRKNGEKLSNVQEQFVKDCALVFDRVASLIGASRTLKQAERLVAEEWNHFSVRNSQIANSQELINAIQAWKTSGIALSNILETIFYGHK